MLNKLVVILIVFFLAGCSTFYTIPDTTHNKYVKPKVIDQNFNLTGRFFIKTATNNEYGNFSWDKTEKREELNFNTPLGQTVAKIIVESGISTLYSGDKIYTGSNLTILMLNNLGFSIPIEYLHYWVQGVVLPNVAIDLQDQYGFTQLGWKVEYLEWYDNDHPKIIKISKNSVVIKLLLQW